MIGAIKFDEEHEEILLNTLVYGVDQQDMISQTPGLLAHILFMCIKYGDSINNSARMKSISKNMLLAIKETVMVCVHIYLAMYM